MYLKEKGLRFSFARSLKQFNYSIFVLFFVVVLLITFKNLQRTTPVSGDLRLRTKEEAIKALVQVGNSLSEIEMADLTSLVLKGMSMLSPGEREDLRKLQEKFAYKGHKFFSENDMETMRRLNYKGINLLSEEDQSRFHYLMMKGTGKLSND